jgi:hypothetical protein
LDFFLSFVNFSFFKYLLIFALFFFLGGWAISGPITTYYVPKITSIYRTKSAATRSAMPWDQARGKEKLPKFSLTSMAPLI